MITVVIPTLWRSPYLKSILDILEKSPLITQVIIIDNDNSKRNVELDYTKVVTLVQTENIYITASWNKGVAHSRTPYTCLLNDDIVFHPSAFEWLLKNWPQDAGLVGLSGQGINNHCDYRLQPTGHRGYGFGAAMFFKTKQYKPIPEELKLWYNDDWLFKYSSGQHYSFQAPVVGTMSQTLGNTEWNAVKQEDKKVWETNYE
jgi:GT2 family glycosyltransferase